MNLIVIAIIRSFKKHYLPAQSLNKGSLNIPF